MTVYNAIRKPLPLLHPRFIPPEGRCSSADNVLVGLFFKTVPTVFLSSRKKTNKRSFPVLRETFRSVSFRFVSKMSARPNFREASIPREGATIVPVTTAPLFRISNTRHFLPFLPLFFSFRSFLLIVYANAENKRETGRVIFGSEMWAGREFGFFKRGGKEEEKKGGKRFSRISINNR